LQGIGLAVSTSVALFGRIFEVLDLPVDIVERPSAKRLDAVRGEVRFAGASFRYDPDGDWTLRDICSSRPARPPRWSVRPAPARRRSPICGPVGRGRRGRGDHRRRRPP